MFPAGRRELVRQQQGQRRERREGQQVPGRRRLDLREGGVGGGGGGEEGKGGEGMRGEGVGCALYEKDR